MDVFLGIDGGGSQTRAMLCNAQGKVLGVGKAGPSNLQELSHREIHVNLLDAIESAASPLSRLSIRSAFLGLAGIISEKDAAAAKQLAASLPPLKDAAIDADHDIRISLAGGLAGRPGIALIVGTGSSCYGRNESSQSYRCGGWGSLADDIGSGGWIGLRALQLCVRQTDGRDPETALKSEVMKFLGLNNMNDFQHRIYKQGLSRSERARLALPMLELYEKGDPAVTMLIDKGIDGLVELAGVTACKLSLQPANIVLVGGLTENATFRRMVSQAIEERVPRSQVLPAELSPLAGAALLSIQLAERAADDATIKRLSQTTNTSYARTI